MKKPVALVVLGLLAACGGDESPTLPAPVIPNVAGRYTSYYSSFWLVQWERQRDGASGAFQCAGTVTLSQSGTRGASAALSGFVVVDSPCPPQSFSLQGSVLPDGSVRFVTGGPKPPEGQCPAAEAVSYSGVVADETLSVRGSTRIDCPGPGEGPQAMDYIISGHRSSY